MLTQCHGCNDWFHWYCVDKKNQPTAGDWYCDVCGEEKNIHPPEWDTLTIPWHACVVCDERKPATQFPLAVLPACVCPSSGNRTCSLCVYTIVDRSGETMETCKCPTCRVQWTAIRLHASGGVDSEVVQLQHASTLLEDTEEAHASEPTEQVVPTVQIGTALVDDDGGMDDVLAELDEQRAEADDPPYVPPGRRVADDSDEEFDSDDDDSLVSETPNDSAQPAAAAEATRGTRRVKEKASSRSATSRASKLTGKFKQRIVNRITKDKTTASGKKASRVYGSDPLVVPMDAKRLSTVLSLMAEHNDFETDVDCEGQKAITDYYKCLMIVDECNTNNGQGKGNKYPGYLSHILGPDKTFNFLFEITRSSQSKALRALQHYVRTDLVQNGKNKVEINGHSYLLKDAPDCAKKEKAIDKLCSNYKHGINVLLDLLDKVKAGTLLLPARPAAAASASTPSGLSASSGSSPGSSRAHAGAPPPAKRRRVLGDPDSPSAIQTVDLPDDQDGDDDGDDDGDM
jgi:hypothetical protein